MTDSEMNKEMNEEVTETTGEEQEALDEEQSFMTIAGLGAIIGFIVPLIMWIMQKKDFSNYAKKYLLDILNFEIFMFILVFAVSFVPFFRHLIYTCLFIFNLIVALRAFSASREKKEYSFPIKVKFVK